MLSLFAPAPALAASVGPGTTRFVYGGSAEIVPIPADVPHEQGDMIDHRIVPDLRWIAAHFPIYVTDGYSGPLGNRHVGCRACHVRGSDHYNGLAVDIVPLHWSDRCDRHWRGITRLAHWAEPVQNRPRPPFRWVGYNGDAGHGCGNHLHLSWEHSPARPYELAEWVEVFRVSHREIIPPKSPPEPEPAPGPFGGVSMAQTGGISAHD